MKELNVVKALIKQRAYLLEIISILLDNDKIESDIKLKMCESIVLMANNTGVADKQLIDLIKQIESIAEQENTMLEIKEILKQEPFE